MIFELMETHFRRLAEVVKIPSGHVPAVRDSNILQRLSLGNNPVVTVPPPESAIVIGASGLVGLRGLHLGLTEVLD